MHDLVVTNARLYPMTAGETSLCNYDSFAVDDGRVSAVPARGPARETFDAGGRLVLPGFIDCHTHALYAGDRVSEHAALRGGASYADIAARGGGIKTTVKAVRDATPEQLVTETLPRLGALTREGVTGIEIKSGYGLDHANEIKMLRAIDALRAHVPMDIDATFLGAHTVPPDANADDYLATLIETTLPTVVADGLATAVDIYVEPLAFSVEHMCRLFSAAADAGLARRVHAEQLSLTGAAQTAAHLGARSADHLEYLDADGVDAMATAGVVAVLLPGAYYFLAETRRPPVAALRERGVDLAVATDLNPGTSPLCSLLTAAHLAVHLFGLTPAEALKGITVNAAKALGREHERGHLGVGASANFSVWSQAAPEFLFYQMGGLTADQVFYRGRPL